MPTLQDGQNAIAQGNLQQARLIFEALLQENTRNQEAWLGLAEVLTDTEDKRICYENVLKRLCVNFIRMVCHCVCDDCL